MSFDELINLGGTDWGLLVLAGILLYMFAMRYSRSKDFLGIAGTISTLFLIALLFWQGWSRYTVMNTILDIARQPAGQYRLVTQGQREIEVPKVLTIDSVRYIIDLTDQKQTRHLPWNLVALPR